MSHETLQARVRMLSWFCQMLQIPWPCFEVVHATEAFTQRVAQGAPEHFLVQTAAEDGQERQVMGLRSAELPVGQRGTTKRFLTKAQVSKQRPLLPWVSVPLSFQPVWEMARRHRVRPRYVGRRCRGHPQARGWRRPPADREG